MKDDEKMDQLTVNTHFPQVRLDISAPAPRCRPAIRLRVAASSAAA